MRQHGVVVDKPRQPDVIPPLVLAGQRRLEKLLRSAWEQQRGVAGLMLDTLKQTLYTACSGRRCPRVRQVPAPGFMYSHSRAHNGTPEGGISTPAGG